MKQKLYQFSVPYYRFLDEKGQLEQPLSSRSGDPQQWVDAYKTMVLIRNFDAKAISLQRTGQLGTYPSVLGQEAIGVAMGQLMRKDDVLVPYYRDIAAQYLRGVRLFESLLYWGGDERGSDFAECPEDLPNCVPVATQLGHAAGIAAAFKIRGQKRAVVTSCGEGGTSKGDFLESLNLAGAWHLPMVVVVNNNQWAISTPQCLQTASETIAQKAIGAGIKGVQVDGNDYFAMVDALDHALERAHGDKGATLIEAITYRLGDHTTADDASRYRSQQALKEAWSKDPVKRLQQFLFERKLWTESLETDWQQTSQETIASEVESYLKLTPAAPESMFEHLFAEMPLRLQSQYEAVAKGGE